MLELKERWFLYYTETDFYTSKNLFCFSAYKFVRHRNGDFHTGAMLYSTNH